MKNKTSSLIFLALFQIFLIISVIPIFTEQVSALNMTKVKDFYNENFREQINYSMENQFTAGESLSGVNWSCCPQLENSAICQNIPNNQENQCSTDLIPADCNFVSDCQLGCCVDNEEGLCSTKVPRLACEIAGGEWNNKLNCEVSECQKGCCVLGSNIEYTTEKRCDKLSVEKGIEADYRSFTTEWECLALQESQKQGACLFSNNVCKFLTESECLRLDGLFKEDYLCSNPDLNTTCEKQERINCLDGKDEIYWFDSCGNRENIYSSDKDASWNNGFVLEKTESCNPDSANKESEDCGNCDYSLSSLCTQTEPGEGVKDGDYICEDLSCKDPETGEIRKNGESWCVYDSYIGDGKDTPGSRHWKRSCIEGEIVVEACADRRAQICAQAEIESEEKKDDFSFAQCIPNEAVTCTSLDNEECAEKEQCTLKRIDIDKGFKFDICTGKYPRGFDLSPGGSATDYSSSICGLVSTECLVVYVKDWKGSWDCEQNCDCEKKEFAEKMNEACIGLGDCGSYVNYLGKGTNSIVVKNSPSVSWKDYIQYSRPVEGQYANPESLEKILEQLNMNYSGFTPGTEEFEEAINTLSQTSGAIGSIAQAASWAIAKYGAVEAGTGSISLGGITGMSGTTATAISALGTITICASIGMWAGSFIAKKFGAQGDGALAIMIGGAAIGIGIGVIWALGSSNFWNPAGWVLIVVGVVLTAWSLITGWGDTKEIHVEFDCLPWKPPLGGDDCDKCDDDPLRPCSEYRCESLGLACQFLNKNTEYPSCEAVPDDGKPPVITPGGVTEGYKFKEKEQHSVKIRQENGECVPEFEEVLFSLDTNEPAQCRYSFEREVDFEEMSELFMEGNAYLKNHTNMFMMPSIDSFEHTYNVSGDIREKLGNLDLFVKCQDTYGDVNEREYAVDFCLKTGPDITPAKIAYAKPSNNSYIRFGASEVDAIFMMNEPAECKWDAREGINYDSMQNIMDCDTSLVNQTPAGWPCETTLTGIKNGTNNFYIKCKDQPWLPPTNQSRNINTKDYVYKLTTSNSELEIISIEPSEEVESNIEPISVTMEVETAGGAKDGKSTCYYQFSNHNKETRFFYTFSNTHKNTWDMLMKGTYDIKIRCEDDAGNIAQKQTELKLKIDTEPPQIVRAYKSGQDLEIITDEEAECYYSMDHCFFDITNATAMTTALSKVHRTEWEQGKVYHIKCADVWGIKNNECAAIVEAE